MSSATRGSEQPASAVARHRRLVVSASAARRLAAASAWLEERPHGGLLLGPSRGAVDDLVRASCCSGRGRLAVRRLTLARLASELAAVQLSRRGVVPVSELGAEAIAARTAHAAHGAGELAYFGPVAALPGFPRALRTTVRELRLERLDPERLRSGGRPGADLSRLLERYEAELERFHLADRAEVLVAAAAEVRRGTGSAAGDPASGGSMAEAQPLLLLDLELNGECELELLASLAGTAPDVLATAPRGDAESLHALAQVLECEPEDLDRGDGEAPDRLSRVQRYVFGYEVAAPAPKPADEGGEGADNVELFSAPGEGLECVEIARRARDLAASGVPFDQMAILLRQSHTYLPLLEDALRRARIPAFFTRGTARPDPAGRAFLGLLACAAEGLTASRFAEYLSLGQVPALDPSGRPPEEEVPWVEPQGDQFVLKSLEPTPARADPEAGEERDDRNTVSAGGSLSVPAQWERLLVDAAVVGGSERWERRLRGLEAELRLKLRELADEEESRRAHLERQLERLGHLERFALPMVRYLDELPASATWGVWLERLERLAGMALRQPETVLALLAELRPMDEVGPVDLDHVRAVLHDRLLFLRREPPRRRYGHLFVGQIEEVRGRSFEVVFLPGLAEGIFPRATFEDPLLLDHWRERVAPGLMRQEGRVKRERLLLRLAVGAAERRLVLSYPSLDLGLGRARVPSFYALDLLRAATGTLPELRELGKLAARTRPRLGWPAPSRCEQAIDDAEYDLALLHPLLRQAPAATRGRGRFLLQCNEHLERTLRSRARRWRRGWSGADGLVVGVGDDAEALTRAALAEHRLDRRSYSPTALQNFAACPYRFFLQAIQRLRPRDEIATFEQLDPLTRGSLFHDTQFELFGELERAGLLPLERERLLEILDLVDRVLDRNAERFAEELAPAIPRVWRTEIESLRTDLRIWIKEVIENDDRWHPLHFELAFGLRGMEAERRDRASQTEPVEVLDGIRLRGAIDLVEQEREGKRLRVTDHKTGLAPRERGVVVGGGRLLQPVLYALAVERLLGGDQDRVESGRLYYCTQRGGYEEVEVALGEESREAARGVLATIDRAIADGFLPAAPAERDCRYCDYRPVCGPYEELRVKRKRQDRLAPLRELRGRR